MPFSVQIRNYKLDLSYYWPYYCFFGFTVLLSARYIEVKVGNYLLFRFFSKKSKALWGMKKYCLHLLSIFHLFQPFNKQRICSDFETQNNNSNLVLLYLPWLSVVALSTSLLLSIFQPNYFRNSKSSWQKSSLMNCEKTSLVNHITFHQEFGCCNTKAYFQQTAS